MSRSPGQAEITSHDLEQYLETMSANASEDALELVDDVVRRGVPVRDVLLNLVGPVQERLGLLWLTNEWSTVQEHRASAISNRVIDRLDAGLLPPSVDATRLLVGCVREEWHSNPSRILASVLRCDGYDVKMLGANTSSEMLIGHAKSFRPRAVMLSASLSASLVAAQQTISSVREIGTPVVVGGSGFRRDETVARRVGASALGEHPDDVPALLETLPHHVAPAGRAEHSAEASFIEASRHWLTMHAADEACGGVEDPRRDSFEWFVMSEQLPFVFGSLAAAVLVDEPRLYRDTIAWFRQVLHHRRLPTMYIERAQRASLDRLRDAPRAAAIVEQALTDADLH